MAVPAGADDLDEIPAPLDERLGGGWWDDGEHGQEGGENDPHAAQAITACAAVDGQRVRGEAITASVSGSKALDLSVRTTSAYDERRIRVLIWVR